MKPTPIQIIRAHQFLYYQGRAVWSDYEYDSFCKKHGIEGSGGSDLASDYSKEEIKLAEWFEKNPHKMP